MHESMIAAANTPMHNTIGQYIIAGNGCLTATAGLNCRLEFFCFRFTIASEHLAYKQSNQIHFF